MNKIKIAFMGTPEFAVPVLEGLIKNYNVGLVVTQPDKLVGRHQELKYSPIKEVAIANNIEVFQPIKIRDDYQKILDFQPDIIITCAYGQIIPKVLLETPRFGCINVHASLLPKLRGGAPIHKALIDGYNKTGITIMYMDETMDTGDIISQKEYQIKDTDNVGILHDVLSKIGAELLLETLPSIINNTNLRISQNSQEATYAYNIRREEEHIEFNKTAREIYNQVRGLNPWPLANIILNGEEMKIIECSIVSTKSKLSAGTIIDITKESFIIKAKDQAIAVTKVKPFGKKVMSTKDYLNGIDKNKIINKIVG